MSALLSSSSAPLSGVESATPTLCRTRTSVRRATNGAPSASTSARPADRDPRCSSTPSSRTANSSPASRATVSVVRTVADQPLGHRLQQPIAGIVAERVVDVLEVVEIQEHHRDVAPRAPGQRQRVLDAIAKQVAIGEPRQRIVEGQLAQLLLEALALADVAEVQRQALHRRVVASGCCRRFRASDVRARDRRAVRPDRRRPPVWPPPRRETPSAARDPRPPTARAGSCPRPSRLAAERPLEGRRGEPQRAVCRRRS